MLLNMPGRLQDFSDLKFGEAFRFAFGAVTCTAIKGRKVQNMPGMDPRYTDGAVILSGHDQLAPRFADIRQLRAPGAVGPFVVFAMYLEFVVSHEQDDFNMQKVNLHKSGNVYPYRGSLGTYLACDMPGENDKWLLTLDGDLAHNGDVVHPNTHELVNAQTIAIARWALVIKHFDRAIAVYTYPNPSDPLRF